MFRFWLFLLAFGLTTSASCWVSTDLYGAIPNGTPAETVVFRKPLGEGRELVLIRGPSRSPNEVLRLIANPEDQQIKSVFPLRVELHAPNDAPFTLAVRLGFEHQRQGGFEVLDVLTGRGMFVIATAEHGEIALWKISALSLDPSRVVALDQGDWTSFAAFVRLDHTMVAVKLGWTKEGLVEVDVDDLRPHVKQRTKFLQAGKPWEWEFKRVSGLRGEKPK